MIRWLFPKAPRGDSQNHNLKTEPSLGILILISALSSSTKSPISDCLAGATAGEMALRLSPRSQQYLPEKTSVKHNVSKAFAFIYLLLVGLVASGQDAANEAQGDTVDATAEIAAAVESYLAAYNSRDVDKLVSHWSPEGVYISRTSGDRVVGRDALTEEFNSIFANENSPTLAAVTESIEFISPNVALERGTATVTYAEDNVVETDYSVVYVKRDGAWLIDRVTEDEITAEPSNYDHLKDLEWLVGQWVNSSDDGITIEINCQWTKKQNYLSRSYTVSNQDEVESSGLQIIGWDPKQKEIRSWLFDSEGGFVSGTWNKRDNHWVVQSVATLADGGSGSFTGVYRPTVDGNLRWQKINQVVDGTILPNTDEMVIERK